MAELAGADIFDHRGGEVDGRNFTQWFINEYMISNETLFHKDPATGKPQVIGLGWIDDAMSSNGPTEEDRNYIADTGASSAEMAAQVAAYEESMRQLVQKVLPMGGFWWQLMDGRGMQIMPESVIQAKNGKPSKNQQGAGCLSKLRQLCVPKPSQWNKMQMYNIGQGGRGVSAQNFTDFTAEFLLTRGPFAMLGYSWCGCTNGQEMRPRAAEWDMDTYGEPTAACAETGAGTGVFERSYSGASVQWDCNAGHGKITPK